MARDYSRWLEDASNPDVTDFVEGGGYGTFAGWWGSGSNRGFMTSNNDGRPPGGSYFRDGKYFTVSGTDQRMIPPDYELIGIDDPVTDGDVGSQYTTPGRMILKRRKADSKERSSSARSADDQRSSPNAEQAPRVDASFPSLAQAMHGGTGGQGSTSDQRPALGAALGSALQMANDWRKAGRAGERDSTDFSSPGGDGARRRYAGSERWRERIRRAHEGMAGRSPYPAAS